LHSVPCIGKIVYIGTATPGRKSGSPDALSSRKRQTLICKERAPEMKQHGFKFDDGDVVTMNVTGRVVKRSTETTGDSYLVEYPVSKGRTAAKWFKEADLVPGTAAAEEIVE
jgi:hypothetical protein